MTAIDAELALEGEHAFDVWTEDDTLVVNAPSLWSLRELQSLAAALPVDPRGAPPVPVEVRVRRATVARAGRADDGVPTKSAFARLAGVPAAPDWRGVLVAAARALG
ncbi:MAG: hypothetical protein ABEH77_00470 [Halobacteriaceae archaeon]